MSDPSRLARFVGSARRLLVFQLLASAGAVAVIGWAVVEVRGLVEENERLEARVAELEAVRPVMPADPIGEAAPEAAPAPEVTAPGVTVQPESGVHDVDQEDGQSVETTPPPPPPPPPETCRALDGAEIDCVPPFRRFPNTSVCIDGNSQRMQCPKSVTETVSPPPPRPIGRRPIEGIVTERPIQAPPERTRRPVR